MSDPKRQEESAPTRPDETIPGGKFIDAAGHWINANGQYIDANGKVVEEPVEAEPARRKKP